MEIRQKNKTSLDFCLLVFLITSSRRGGQFSWVTWTELEKKYKICIFYIFCCSAGVIWSSLSEEYVHNKNQQTYRPMSMLFCCTLKKINDDELLDDVLWKSQFFFWFGLLVSLIMCLSLGSWHILPPTQNPKKKSSKQTVYIFSRNLESSFAYWS